MMLKPISDSKYNFFNYNNLIVTSADPYHKCFCNVDLAVEC